MVVLALAAVSAAYPVDATVAKTDGSEFLQLQDGHGLASARVRGTYFGRVHRGRIIASSKVSEAGCETRKRLENGFRLCRGRDITFWTPSDARWRVRLRGHGISATGWVRGCLRLDGRNNGPTGSFKIGFSTNDARPWPRKLTSYRLGSGEC